ncbi:hypothetical protein CFII64_27408 [Pseudomonas sp. CFII64]|uniref:hypothetical protein n=1 Tax=Pseudomonas sp. CFII64 TaxID=911242 RepID=UPI0003578CA6|nr:hypothetical protein [Pseudomonas sp. CFII64]EPJ76907.1 hypothetical protein CFII64_27408 [Pseudomonas sp. CFII64]
MYLQSTRPHPNWGAGFITTQLNRQGANFDASAYRCEDPTQVFDLNLNCTITGVPRSLAPALVALSMGFSQAALTKFMRQAEVRLEDIEALRIWDNPDWSLLIASGSALTASDLTVRLVGAMAACPIQAYVMEKSLRSTQFKPTTIAALLHSENPELWTSTRLGSDRETLLPLLPINICAPHSFSSVMDIPNHNWADFLTRSGVLSQDYIRKVYGLDWFYEALLLELTKAGPDTPSAILSHIEYLTDEQQDCFITGLLNAVFLDLNENTAKVQACDLISRDVEKRALLITLQGVMSELIQDEWECPVTTAINYLPEEFVKGPGLISRDPLFSALHDSDSLLKRFCDELLNVPQEAFCLADFVAMSNLARLSRFSYEMTGIDTHKVLDHVIQGCLYFLGSQCDYFCDSSSSKAGVDSLVIEGLRDFTYFFRTNENKEFDLHLDFSQFTAYDLLILRLADVHNRKMPSLPDFALEALERFWAH